MLTTTGLRMKFAEKTTVPVAKSRAEIETLITRYGAHSTAFMNSPGRALIMFEAHNRRIVFELPLPSASDPKFARDGRGSRRTPLQIAAAVEQAHRQRWRALALVIKAKLEAVESGITSFEDEFLAHIMMPDGRRVGDHVKPTIAQVYNTGSMQPLLPPPGENK